MNRRLPRVLFVGSARYDLPLPDGLRRKWDAVTCRIDARVIGRAGNVMGHDARFRLLPLPRWKAPGSYQAALPLLVTREVRRFQPDVVIAQSPWEAVSVLLSRLAVSSRPPLVVEVHGDWRTATRLYGSRTRRIGSRAADRVAVFALRHADATRALSGFTASLAEHATGRPPIAVFPTYFDLASFRALPVRPLPDQPTVLWVGMFQRYKNPHLLAHAWHAVANRVSGARLVMVGDGPLRYVAEGLVERFPDRARYVPNLPPEGVSREMDESTALALPSWSEGMGRVVIESFTRGRPVVGSASGGIPDLVDPGRNGLLVPPGEPNRLADALVRVLSDDALAKRLAEGAREDARQYEWTAERYADAMRELVDRALTLA